MLALSVYLGAYVLLRSTWQLVHVHNDVLGNGHEVLAMKPEWLDTLNGTIGDSGSWAARSHAFASRCWPPLLDAVFWPLRHLEASLHKTFPPKRA